MALESQSAPLRGLRPDPALTLAPLPRRQASLETNLCRKGVWHVGPLQLALPIDSSDTLGLLRVAGPPLTLFDLDTFAWLTERWREGDRDPKGRVRFTLYELGKDLHNRVPSGRDRQEIRASLGRLHEADFELEGYDPRAAAVGQLENPTGVGGRIRLLGSMFWAGAQSRDPHIAGLDWWIVEQLEAGYLTYLDWRVLRSLEGLAKRLWVYLESQTFKRSEIGEGAVALQLAPPMWQALGVTTKHAPHARRLLLRAGERISAADKSFVGWELRKPRRRGGTWALVARRRLTARRLS
ncbi:MAG: hypothetical protein FWD04_06630 [Conexibacteraceae bacterium]|nr:hypothetical protein [Conexibacteraceae bacterium]